MKSRVFCMVLVLGLTLAVEAKSDTAKWAMPEMGWNLVTKSHETARLGRLGDSAFSVALGKQLQESHRIHAGKPSGEFFTWRGWGERDDRGWKFAFGDVRGWGHERENGEGRWKHSHGQGGWWKHKDEDPDPVAAVPEPGSIFLVGTGLVLVMLMWRMGDVNLSV
jgi:hypothetical protein